MLTSPKILHLEPTDVCNLECPLCARVVDTEFNSAHQNHLNVNQIKALFSVDEIKCLDKMFMCGNYGDPAAGKFTLELYRYFREVNTNIILGMNTSGSLRNVEWWIELAHILNKSKDYVVFSIDGLEDTNHIYRVNSIWDKIITNATAFIRAGGQAHWDMLVYRHNEHQVEAAIQLARQIGFKWFRTKVSKRPLVNGLETPVHWVKPSITLGTIDCIALREQSLYVDATGRISPCCWLGARKSNFIADFDQVKASWLSDKPEPTCLMTCGTRFNISNFENQWTSEVEL